MENGIESISTHNHATNILTCDKYTKHSINISMDKTSCISSDYRYTGLTRQGNNPNKETLIYIPHIRCHYPLSSSNLSCPQGNRTRVCLE